MAIANADKNVGRQYPLVAYQEFDFADLSSTEVTPIVKLPANAIVTGGALVITTAFNSGTTDLLEVGDSVQDDDYLVAGTADNGSTAQYIAFTPSGYKYAAPDTIDVKWTPVGTAATAGAGYLVVEYIVPTRANEVVPDYS
jgi:hypothetical protein